MNRQKGWFYELDVRSKLILSICVTALVFLWADPRYLAGLVVVLMILSLSAGMGAKATMKPFLYLLPFALAIVLIHALFNDAGKTVLLGPVPEHIPLLGGHFVLKTEGAFYGLAMAFRMFALVLILPPVISTSTTSGIILGLVRSGVPYTIAFVVASAMRFIPLLLEEARGIIDSQKVRGLPVDSANILTKARVYSRIAVPLIVGAVVKSLQIELVLQARGFTGSNERTYLHEAKTGPVDYVLTFTAAAAVIVAVYCRAVHSMGGFPF